MKKDFNWVLFFVVMIVIFSVTAVTLNWWNDILQIFLKRHWGD